MKKKDNMFHKIAFALACNGTKTTIDNVKFSVAFNKLFSDVDTQEKFDKKVEEMSKVLEKETYFYYRNGAKSYLSNLLNTLEEARDIKKAALKRKSTGAFNKIMDDLDFVKIDQEKYPLTHEAVHSGTLPLGTFFRKGPARSQVTWWASHYPRFRYS